MRYVARIVYICRQNYQLLTKNKIMKRILFTICMALMSAGAFAQNYYEELSEPEAGDWGVGFGIAMGTGSGITNFGMCLPKIQYYFHPNVRVEFSFDYFFKKDYITDWDLNLNVHPYVIPMKYGMHIYPIVGLTFTHRHWSDDIPLIPGEIKHGDEGRIGLNIGGGFQYDITENISAIYEVKYQYVEDYDRCGMNLGMVFRF